MGRATFPLSAAKAAPYAVPMVPSLASALSPMLRRLDPERAHRLAILALRAGLAGAGSARDDDALAVTVAGCRFPNPIGIAAGFDKDAKALRGLVRLGFGFVEAGTVTLRPQPGNQRPRVFRLVEDEAVINRYGLNSEGYDAVQQRLDRLPRAGLRAGVGVNLGPNKDGDAERDLPPLVARLSTTPGVGYAAINVSSPNTPGLRDLQQGRRLASLLAAIKAACPRPLPIMVKIAPDQGPGALGDIVETCAAAGATGLIISNTTVDRPATLRSPARGEAGGLSGRPLFESSTQLLRDAHCLARGRLLLVGCGGIRTGADALAKIKAGASLVQIYTAFAYAGPAIVPRLKRELLEAMRAEGYARISDAVGVGA